MDVAIEDVGIPQTFDLCQKLIDSTFANVGVHGLPVQFDIDKLWIKNINVTTGFPNTTEELLKLSKSKIST